MFISFLHIAYPFEFHGAHTKLLHSYPVEFHGAHRKLLHSVLLDYRIFIVQRSLFLWSLFFFHLTFSQTYFWSAFFSWILVLSISLYLVPPLFLLVVGSNFTGSVKVSRYRTNVRFAYSPLLLRVILCRRTSRKPKFFNQIFLRG